MKAVLGFLLIGGGLTAIYLVFTGQIPTSIPQAGTNSSGPVTNAGIANNTADIPSQTGSGAMSFQSAWNNLGHALAYQPNDRHASRGGMR
jgi:hypothetical protein